MAVVKTSVGWVLTLLWTLTRGDPEVLCVFMGSCILPCPFKPGADAVIHWIQETGGNQNVHSFYHNQDQLAYQDQRFRDRTSLFKDQVSRGNASLQMTGVEVQDQGRYKCYTSTITGNQESFIDLKVEAPVGKVNIQQVENRITCSSEGIYPEPQLTWSTSPPSNDTFKNTTPQVQRSEQLLYNIGSSLTLTNTDLNYICIIKSGGHEGKATLFRTTSITGSSTATTIPCTESKTSFETLVWRFNHSQIIVNQTDISERWRQNVNHVLQSGSLELQDLSSDHEGTYTCELSDAEETLITNTFVRMKEDVASNVAGITIGVIAGAVLLVSIAALAFKYKKAILQIFRKRGKSKDKKSKDSQPKQSTDVETSPLKQSEAQRTEEVEEMKKSRPNGQEAEITQTEANEPVTE